MLDYRIYTFLKVCSLLNYTKAASELNMTQPNVSQHIRGLEEYYGQKLFETRGKRLFLTEAGALLQKAAVSMCRESELVRQEISRAAPRRFVFGITRSINESALQKNVMKFLRDHMEYQLGFKVDNTKRLSSEIENLKMDFAIVEGNFDTEKFDHVELSRENFIAVRGREYSLHGPVQTLADLLEERVIVRENGSGTREILESVLNSRNLGWDSFASMIEIGEIGAIKELLRSGCGITFLYETAVREELKRGELVKIPLEDFELQHAFCMIWLRTSIQFVLYQELARECFGTLLE